MQVTESPHLHHEPPASQRESAGQSTTPPNLPPAGPSWAAAVMGSASLAQVVEIYWGASVAGHAAAVIWHVLATAMLVWIIAGFIRHRNPQFVPEHLPAWAMTAMGILALSMATSVVLGWGVVARCLLGNWHGAGFRGFDSLPAPPSAFAQG